MCDLWSFTCDSSGAFMLRFKTISGILVRPFSHIHLVEPHFKKRIMFSAFHLGEPFHLGLPSCSQADGVISVVDCGESSRAVRQTCTRHSRLTVPHWLKYRLSSFSFDPSGSGGSEVWCEFTEETFESPLHHVWRYCAVP